MKTRLYIKFQNHNNMYYLQSVNIIQTTDGNIRHLKCTWKDVEVGCWAYTDHREKMNSIMEILQSHPKKDYIHLLEKEEENNDCVQ